MATVLLTASLGGGAALAQSTYERRVGPYHSGTAVEGAYGNDAQHAQGPRGAATSVEGRGGTDVSHARGPEGGGTAVKTPSGKVYTRSHKR
jgi:hypothetical protein